MSEDSETQLIAEQLMRTIDLLRAEIAQLRQIQDHDREMAGHRLRALEEQARDQESRIRTATDGVAQLKVWSGLASGGSWLLSLFALIRAWIGF